METKDEAIALLHKVRDMANDRDSALYRVIPRPNVQMALKTTETTWANEPYMLISLAVGIGFVLGYEEAQLEKLQSD